MITGHSHTLAAALRGRFSFESLETRNLLSGGHFHEFRSNPSLSTFSTQSVTASPDQTAVQTDQTASSPVTSWFDRNAGATDAREFQSHDHRFITTQGFGFTPAPSTAGSSVQLVIISIQVVPTPGSISFAPAAGTDGHDFHGYFGTPQLPPVYHQPNPDFPAFSGSDNSPIKIPTYPSSPDTSDTVSAGSANRTSRPSRSRNVPTLSVSTSANTASSAAQTFTVIAPSAALAVANIGAHTHELLSTAPASLVTAAASQFTPASLSTTTLRLAGIFSGTRVLDWTGIAPTQSELPQSTAIPAAVITTPLPKVMSSVLPPSRFYYITHLPNPLALLNDSLSNFVDEAATTSTTVAKSVASEQAALITVAVIAADVAILTYVRRNRPQRRSAIAFADNPNFIPGM
jgi:hypothetical protein